MQINLQKYREKFQQFLHFVRIQHYYTSDYVYKYDKFSTGHVVVLKIPYIFKNAMYNFIKGKYSLMYSEEQINKYFGFRKFDNKTLEREVNKIIKSTRDVFLKDEKRKKAFIKRVNFDFDTNIKEEMFNDNFELDYPPRFSEEIFNYTPSKGDFWN
mgnify:FL=1